MNIKRKLIGGAAGLAASALVAMPAHAFSLIDNYDFYFDATGPGGANAVSTFLGNGSSFTEIDAFASNGDSFVIQQNTGGLAGPQTGDRFYDIGYLRVDTIATSGVTSNIGFLTGGAGVNSMYFFFELGGTINAGNGTYTFDMGSVSLMVDNDGGSADFSDPDLGNLMNRLDGYSFNQLRDGLIGELTGLTFAMPPAGGAIITPVGMGAPTDGSLIELARMQFLPGSGGEIPTGFNIPNSQETGDFGVDLAVTSCELGVMYDESGVDICTRADADPKLSNFFWAVSGQSTGRSFSDALIAFGGGFIAQQITLGDSADIGKVPEPGSLALMGLGLLGLGGLARRARKS